MSRPHYENWKPSKYPGYEVSDAGNVRETASNKLVRIYHNPRGGGYLWASLRRDVEATNG